MTRRGDGREGSALQLIRTPDQRLRVFVSSTLGELAAERAAVRQAIERLRLTPVMFELGARPHPPRELYRAYLDQSHVFLGIYWQRYGWVAPSEAVSGLEDEYRLAGARPRLLYIKHPAPEREDRLSELIAEFQADDHASYKPFATAEELASLVEDDLALLLSERFEVATPGRGGADATGSERRSGVPVPLTDTIGRGAELDDVTRAIREARRLVTITGPGGIGKTRLAIEVARRVEPEFPDGAHFVALADVADVDDAFRTIARVLGRRVEGSGVADAVARELQGERALIVLDNLEQIAGLGAALAELLERLPKLHILATSRHRLRVRGEWTYSLATLALPDAAAAERDEIATVPSVALFVDRARDVLPMFTLTDENAGVVAAIVRCLEGVPLAIELAAARSRVLSLASLLERVTRSIDALTDAASDLPERQRALRATLEWSHDLLTEAERRLFARLSVFAGGWTLEAAEAVCGAPGEPEVIETLAALLDKSLVISDPEETGLEPRFRMLATVHVFASERLHERGETGMVELAHLRWCQALAEQAQPGLCGPGQREWVTRMSPERVNLRKAVDTALATGDHHAVVELAWDVVVLYFVRDEVHEPDSWLRRVADAEPRLDEVTDAKLRALLALTRIHHGDFEGVESSLVGALAVFESTRMDFERAVVLHQLAFVRYHLDHDVGSATDTLEASSALFAKLDHDWGVSLTEAMLGSLFAATGDLSAAERHQLRALEHARQIDSDQQTAQALGQISLVRLLQERHDEALGVLRESAHFLRSGRYRADTANALDALAVVAHHRGDGRAAARAVCVASAERSRQGVTPWPTLRPFLDRIHRWVRLSLGEEGFEDIGRSAADDDVFDTFDSTLRALDGGLEH